MTAAHSPNARARLAPSNVLVMIASEPGHEQRAREALQQPADDEQLQARRQAAQDRREAEADQPDDEDPPAAVVVAERAGEDQERGEGREVARR